MPIRVTVCVACMGKCPQIQRTIEQLQAELAERLVVVALDCMAACDDLPAAMIEYDYWPRISPQVLRSRVLSMDAELRQQDELRAPESPHSPAGSR